MSEVYERSKAPFMKPVHIDKKTTNRVIIAEPGFDMILNNLDKIYDRIETFGVVVAVVDISPKPL